VLLRALAIGTGRRLRLHGRLHSGGDLLVQRPSLSLTLLLGLLTAVLGLVLPGFQSGFTAASFLRHEGG
jgi:hypothetical protein